MVATDRLVVEAPPTHGANIDTGTQGVQRGSRVLQAAVEGYRDFPRQKTRYRCFEPGEHRYKPHGEAIGGWHYEVLSHDGSSI